MRPDKLNAAIINRTLKASAFVAAVYLTNTGLHSIHAAAPPPPPCDTEQRCMTPQLARICNIEPGDSICVEMTSVFASTTRTFLVNGIPNHPIGLFPIKDDLVGCGRPTAISSHLQTITLPRTPTGSKADLVLPNAFGVAVNGVLFDPLAAEFWAPPGKKADDCLRDPEGCWQKNALLHPDMATDLDCNMAHIQPDGHYHYHGLPTGLYEKLGGTYPWDSPAPSFFPGAKTVLLGWAFDGAPIYGPTCYKSPTSALPFSGWWKPLSGWVLKSGRRKDGPPGDYNGDYVDDFEYKPKPKKPGDLDEYLDDCNGHTKPTPEFPDGNGVYHYHITEEYPYIPHCFHHTPADNNIKDFVFHPPLDGNKLHTPSGDTLPKKRVKPRP